MSKATTTTCAEALLSSWISRFGVPDDITTDRGPAFLSELWASLAQLMGTSLHSTTAYNPAANRMVERSHRSLKAALMARCVDENWKSQLPWVLLGLRTAPKANGEVSPAERVYGETLVVPGEFFPTDSNDPDTPLEQLQEKTGKFAPCRRSFTDRTKHFTPSALRTCKFAFVRIDSHHPPLTRPYRGPYRIISRNEKAYNLMIHGREDWVSVDRLKPAFVDEDDNAPAVPGRRPRVPPQHRPPANESNETSLRHNRPTQTVESPRTSPGDGILSDDDEEDVPPRQLRSSSRGLLTRPHRFTNSPATRGHRDPPDLGDLPRTRPRRVIRPPARFR